MPHRSLLVTEWSLCTRDGDRGESAGSDPHVAERPGMGEGTGLGKLEARSAPYGPDEMAAPQVILPCVSTSDRDPCLITRLGESALVNMAVHAYP
jgi:hypothetical protein